MYRVLRPERPGPTLLAPRELGSDLADPRPNGKVERLNRTLLNEWAYVRTYTSNAQRTRALGRWLHTYNYHRGHASLGGRPPI